MVVSPLRKVELLFKSCSCPRERLGFNNRYITINGLMIQNRLLIIGNSSQAGFDVATNTMRWIMRLDTKLR